MPNEPFYKTKAWRKLRLNTLYRDKFTCTQCGASVAGKGRSRVDHIKPRRSHPELALEPTNVRTLCINCDAKRHAEKGGGPERNPVGADGYPPGW